MEQKTNLEGKTNLVKTNLEKLITETFCEVELTSNENFLKIKETLSRMGIKKNMKLYQSCHILFKRGKYYIVHFKELFGLDGKEVKIQEYDIMRKLLIIKLLEKWGLLIPKDKQQIEEVGDKLQKINIDIIPFKEKDNYELIEKYNLGKYHKKVENK